MDQDVLYCVFPTVKQFMDQAYDQQILHYLLPTAKKFIHVNQQSERVALSITNGQTVHKSNQR